MTHDPLLALKGIGEKLARAKENIINLNTEIDAFLGEDRSRIVTEENREAVKQFLDEHIGRRAPVRFSVLAAECIHNLRTALEQLAWQLVIANGKRPTKNDTKFPLLINDPATIEDVERRENALSSYRRNVKGMSAAAQAYILALQPYQPGNGGKDNLLRIVHDPNVTDKHCELVIVKNSIRTNLTYRFKPIVVSELTTFTLAETEDSAVARHGALTLKPVNVDTQVIIQISFGEVGTTRLQPVIDVLWRLHRAVQQVVDHLAGEFT